MYLYWECYANDKFWASRGQFSDSWLRQNVLIRTRNNWLKWSIFFIAFLLNIRFSYGVFFFCVFFCFFLFFFLPLALISVIVSVLFCFYFRSTIILHEFRIIPITHFICTLLSIKYTFIDAYLFNHKHAPTIDLMQIWWSFCLNLRVAFIGIYSILANVALLLAMTLVLCLFCYLFSLFRCY